MSYSKMLTWKNTKIYDRRTACQFLTDVKKFIRGSLPLYGIAKRKLWDYAKDKEIDRYEALSYYNIVSIDRDIRMGKINKDNAKKIQNNFTKLVKGMDKNNKSKKNLSKVRKFFRSIDGPFHHVFTNIIKLSIYNDLPVDCQKYIQQLHTVHTDSIQDIQKRANEFENSVVEYFREKGFVFRTEEDIRRDQDYNVTPDILFDNPITIRLDNTDYPVHWIDAKNYTLVNTRYIVKGAKKQAAKYNSIFGPGAMIFRYGFDKSIQIPSTLILDGSMIESDSLIIDNR